MVAISKSKRDSLSLDRLKQCLHYNPRTGIWRWLIRKNGVRRNRVAGCIVSSGYRNIEIDGISHPAHVLAWFYMTGEWPAVQVDHRDLRRPNNRWGNLRLATTSQNKANSRARRDNKLGVKGVHKHTRKFLAKPYEASIRVKGKLFSLGYFRTARGAGRAYSSAAKAYFGEFARAS